jgi:hypothetical protein
LVSFPRGGGDGDGLAFWLLLPLPARLLGADTSPSESLSVDAADALLKMTLAPTTALDAFALEPLDRLPARGLPPLAPRWPWTCAPPGVDGLMRLTSRDCGVTSTPSRNTRAERLFALPPPAPATDRLELDTDDAPSTLERDAFTSRLVARAFTRLLLVETRALDGELIVATSSLGHVPRMRLVCEWHGIHH